MGFRTWIVNHNEVINSYTVLSAFGMYVGFKNYQGIIFWVQNFGSFIPYMYKIKE